MKKYAYAGSCFAAGAVLLIAALCAAQTTTISGKAASAASGQTSAANHSSAQKSIAVDPAGGNGVRRAAGPGSTGTNPLYEPHDKAASSAHPKGSHASNQNSAKRPRRFRPGKPKNYLNGHSEGAGEIDPRRLTATTIPGMEPSGPEIRSSIQGRNRC